MRAVILILPLGVGALVACGGGGHAVSPVPAAPLATVAVAAAPPSSASPRVLYALADLRALAARGAWDELLDHLEDVAPAARSREWSALAQQAAVATVAAQTTRGPAAGSSTAEALLGRYPVLRESNAFMTARADVGLRWFERCFDEDPRGDACAARIAPFVAADPSDRELAFRVGKLVPARVRAWSAVPAFAAAIVATDDARCRDPDVRRAVVAGLGLPRSGHEDVVAASVALASKLCARDMRQAVVDAMGSLAPDYFRNVCPFARARLSSLQKKVCEEVSR